MTAYGLTREQSVDLIVRTALEYGITDRQQIAYMLASAQHESDNFNTSREYDGPRQAIRRGYGGGENYYGRGYVQVTHDRNYARMDRELGLGGQLNANPDLVATDAQLGAETLVVGMARGLYTGVGIHRYIGGDSADYRNARRTVNGTDKADLIAGYARNWETQVPDIVDRVARNGIVYRPLPGSSIANDGEFRLGERGIEVQYVQVALDRLGYRDPDNNRLASDGDLASRTEQAIRSFQQDKGLNPTGVADQETLRALGLQQYLQGQNVQQAPRLADPPRAPLRAEPAPPGEPTTSLPLITTEILQLGDRSNVVKALQQHLQLIGARDAEGRTIKDDRDYGERTKEAVEQFQLWTGRATTGIADPDTLEALDEHAQFAARQRAQGVAPGNHLADNLKLAAPNLADAAALRTLQERNAIQDPAAFERGRAIASVQTGLIQLGYQHRTTQPLTVNGVNDEATRQAVTAFQAQSNLPLSGQVDHATQQALQQALLMQQQARQEEEAKRQEETKRREDDPTRQASDPLATPSQTTKAANVQDHAGVRDLREQLSERLEQKGQLAGLSDDRLTQMAGQMYQAGLRADMRFDASVRDGHFYAAASDITHAGKHMSLDLSQPAVSPQQTLQAVAQYDQKQVELAAQQPTPDDPSRGRSM